jgi:hypothetical protein
MSKSTLKVTEITPALFATLRAAIRAALASVEKEHGVTLKMEDTSFFDSEEAEYQWTECGGPDGEQCFLLRVASRSTS